MVIIPSPKSIDNDNQKTCADYIDTHTLKVLELGDNCSLKEIKASISPSRTGQ